MPRYRGSKYPMVKKSYGIVCVRLNKSNNIEILLIRKRSTFYYIEFILKYHSKNDDNKLMFLFNNMTHEEKIDILSFDFGKMWYRIFLVDPDSCNTPDNLRLTSDEYAKYLVCKNNFEKNFLIDKGVKLQNLIFKSQNSECIWEIPKGRKSIPQEKDLVCAIREFQEETDISSDKYYILDDIPLTTNHISSNVKYLYYYYPAIIDYSTQVSKTKNIRINYSNKNQLTEISDIKWMSPDKIKIIDSSGKLYQFAKTVNKIMRKKYKIQKTSEYNLFKSLL